MVSSSYQQYGPWALIAGGSEGIGLAFASQLAEAGLNLVLLARREQPLLSARDELVKLYGVEVRTLAGDLTSPQFHMQIVQLTEALEVGLLVYNAGAVHGAGRYLDEPLSKLETLLALNCHGPLVLTHHFAQGMRERRRGGVVLLSSMSGLTGSAYVTAYSASKAFVIALAEGLWAELYPHGVHCLGLIAGATDTPAMADSGVLFAPDQAMAASDVAREGLQQLPQGPVHIAGEGNRAVEPVLRSADRRQSIALMSAGAAGMYGLDALNLPTADA